jgi:hypothetical protein
MTVQCIRDGRTTGVFQHAASYFSPVNAPQKGHIGTGK